MDVTPLLVVTWPDYTAALLIGQVPHRGADEEQGILRHGEMRLSSL